MNINFKTTTIVFAIISGLLLICCIFCCVTIMRNAKMQNNGMQHSMGDMNMNGGSMAMEMKSMTSTLLGKTGDELDKAFLNEMIAHHEGAVDMAKILQAGTKRPELQKMASDIITVQTKEIDMMKSWLSAWYK